MEQGFHQDVHKEGPQKKKLFPKMSKINIPRVSFDRFKIQKTSFSVRGLKNKNLRKENLQKASHAFVKVFKKFSAQTAPLFLRLFALVKKQVLSIKCILVKAGKFFFKKFLVCCHFLAHHFNVRLKPRLKSYGLFVFQKLGRVLFKVWALFCVLTRKFFGLQPKKVVFPRGLRLTNPVQEYFKKSSGLFTGSGFHLEIKGAGFFSVKTEDGDILYTRKGNFKRVANGLLKNDLGFEMNPRVFIPKDSKSIEISPKGEVRTVSEDDSFPKKIAQIQIYSFSNPAGVREIRPGFFVSSTESGVAKLGQPGEGPLGLVNQGYLQKDYKDKIFTLKKYKGGLAKTPKLKVKMSLASSEFLEEELEALSQEICDRLKGAGLAAAKKGA